MTALKPIRLTAYFTRDTLKRLHFRAIHHHCTSEGYIKRILNDYIANPRLPPAEPFQRLFPLTKSHTLLDVPITSTYPPIYLQHLDNLALSIPPHYGTGNKSRRRLLETLVLIHLFD